MKEEGSSIISMQKPTDNSDPFDENQLYLLTKNRQLYAFSPRRTYVKPFQNQGTD